MSLNTTLACVTSTLRNGYKARKLEINLKTNIIMNEILSILKMQGYIRDYNFSEDKKTVCVFLKYHKEKPSITEIEMISKHNKYNVVSFKKLQFNQKSLKQQNQGLSTFILTTSKGLLTEYDCILNKIGGRIILKIT